MPNPFQIIQEKTVSFDQHGKRAQASQTYIKLSAQAEDLLQELRGARLEFFFAISLHEIAVCEHGALPYTRADVCTRLTNKRTGKALSMRAAIYASQWLVDNNFIYECGARANGEKMYRPCGTYAWFGDDRSAKSADLEQAGYAKSADPVASGSAKIDRRVCKKAQNGLQKSTGQQEEEEVPNLNVNKVPALPLPEKRTRGILSRAGFYGRDLNTLARTVTPELAERWTRWIAYARANLDLKSPVGIAFHRLKIDATAEPPEFHAVVDWENDQALQAGSAPPNDTPVSTTTQEHDPRANAVWHAVCGELQLQMSRATYDTWVRPSRAVAIDADGYLVVHVHSPYAREWLTTRLHTTIERTVEGIVGKALRVRYITTS